MHSVYTKVTDQMNFFEGNDPVRLAREYGTPLYVCNERILRAVSYTHLDVYKRQIKD